MASSGPMIMAVGAAIAAVACCWIGVREKRAAANFPTSAASDSGAKTLEPIWLLLLALAVLAGAIVRLYGLGDKGLSHPEAYVPGLDLPANISNPPRRISFHETLLWHFTSEPHPFGYFLAMWAWTKAFGASLTSIRLPEAIAGVLSLLLIYRVAAMSYGTKVGVVAAAMLALHGLHVFWSQFARMYVPGSCFGLASTWLLLSMQQRKRHGFALPAAYVATLVASAMTVEFSWPFLAVQLLWTAVNYRGRLGSIPRAAYYQALAFMLSAPMLSHVLINARNNAAPPPSLTFLRHYFCFGLLFQQGADAERGDLVPTAIAIGALLLGVTLFVRGIRVRPADPVVDAEATRSQMLPLGLAAIGVSIVMLGIAAFATRRRPYLAILSALPLCALVIPYVASAVRPLLAKFAPRFERWLDRNLTARSLVPLLALVPMFVLFVVSYRLKLMASRAFLMFIPYFIILTAAGAVALARRPVVACGLGAALLATFSTSTVISRRTPTSPRDYRGLAQALNARLEPGDLIFAQPRHWAVTPLFYYLDHQRIVAEHFEAAIRRAPHARIWAIAPPPNADFAKAVETYRAADVVKAPYIRATLYLPPGD